MVKYNGEELLVILEKCLSKPRRTKFLCVDCISYLVFRTLNAIEAAAKAAAVSAARSDPGFCGSILKAGRGIVMSSGLPQ